jgi:alpha-L-rhamnosidase
MHVNKRNVTTLLTVVLIGLPSGTARLSVGAPAGTDFSVQGLRCEYLSDPQGIDVQRPRLNWLLTPAPNVRGQSSYRVLVASTPTMLQ